VSPMRGHQLGSGPAAGHRRAQHHQLGSCGEPFEPMRAGGDPGVRLASNLVDLGGCSGHLEAGGEHVGEVPFGAADHRGLPVDAQADASARPDSALDRHRPRDDVLDVGPADRRLSEAGPLDAIRCQRGEGSDLDSLSALQLLDPIQRLFGGVWISDGFFQRSVLVLVEAISVMKEEAKQAGHHGQHRDEPNRIRDVGSNDEDHSECRSEESPRCCSSQPAHLRECGMAWVEVATNRRRIAAGKEYAGQPAVERLSAPSGDAERTRERVRGLHPQFGRGFGFPNRDSGGFSGVGKRRLGSTTSTQEDR